MYINLGDSYQLTSKLTLKRLTNAYKIYSSFRTSRKTKIPSISGLPISLSVEPTTACNLGCPECPSGLKSFTRPTGRINPAMFQKVIDELSETLIYLILYFQGEPYLNPDFLELVKIAQEQKIYTATSTNAHFLTEANAQATVASGLDRLIISIDGATQQTYESYRKGGKLSKVLAGTKEILYWKKKMKSHTPHIVWQFLVVKPNEHEIPRIKQLAKQYSVSKVAFKSAQIYDYQQGNELIPDNLKYSRYKPMGDGTWSLKHHLADECWKMWHSSVMTWDGRVVPCCFDKDAQHVMGHFTEKSFQEIWTSDVYNHFRKTLLNSRNEIDICNNCTEGGKVWV